MLPADVTSVEKFRSGVVRRGRKLEPGPKDSEVAHRRNAFLPNLAAVRLNVGQTFAQVVHTDGVAVSVMFTRPKPAEPPGELPRIGKEEGAVNPLAHLDADWLGCDPGKTNMATVAHEERYPSGAVKSAWQRSLTAGQYSAGPVRVLQIENLHHVVNCSPADCYALDFEVEGKQSLAAPEVEEAMCMLYCDLAAEVDLLGQGGNGEVHRGLIGSKAVAVKVQYLSSDEGALRKEAMELSLMYVLGSSHPGFLRPLGHVVAPLTS
ncbi:hypothetical protein HaLaN_29807, partial [Haematococcus lacustris]